MVDDILHASVLRLGTTGTAEFVISSDTCHSTLRLPINRQFRPLQVSALRNIQERFAGGKFIVIGELSMMDRNMLVQIEKRLRQASGQEDLPYGVFIVIPVGDLQPLPPVGDKLMYTEGNEEDYLLFNSI